MILPHHQRPQLIPGTLQDLEDPVGDKQRTQSLLEWHGANRLWPWKRHLCFLFSYHGSWCPCRTLTSWGTWFTLNKSLKNKKIKQNKKCYKDVSISASLAAEPAVHIISSRTLVYETTSQLVNVINQVMPDTDPYLKANRRCRLLTCILI